MFGLPFHPNSEDSLMMVLAHIPFSSFLLSLCIWMKIRCLKSVSWGISPLCTNGQRPSSMCALYFFLLKVSWDQPLLHFYLFHRGP